MYATGPTLEGTRPNYGIQRHDSYNVIIPYKTAEGMQLQDGIILHATSSEKTRTIRLHKKELKDSTPVKVRQKLKDISESEILFHKGYHSNRVCKAA